MTIDYTRPPQPPPPAGELKRGWWSRNWKWFVPVGCIGFIALLLIGIAAIVGVVFGAIKSSDVYREALQRAQNHPEVQAALGTPIEAGWWMTGQMDVNNDTGSANLSIPISGPKGKGSVHVVATKQGGSWIYSRLDVEVYAHDRRPGVLDAHRWNAPSLPANLHRLDSRLVRKRKLQCTALIRAENYGEQ